MSYTHIKCNRFTPNHRLSDMTSLCILFPSMSFGVDLKFYGYIIFIKFIMSTLILDFNYFFIKYKIKFQDTFSKIFIRLYKLLPSPLNFFGLTQIKTLLKQGLNQLDITFIYKKIICFLV